MTTEKRIQQHKERKENAVSPGRRTAIYVVTHKSYRMPSDPVYIPLQVGTACSIDSSGKEPDLGYLKDNAGTNISARNPYFCELTGLYWIWKHSTADNIGLVHYRRHFKGDGSVKSGIRGDIFDRVLRGDEADALLSRYKVILPKKRYYLIETLWSHYEHTHYIEHLTKTRQIIAERCPSYLESFDQVMQQRSAHMFNMMIMRRDLLDSYCSWLFDILFALEEQIDCSGYSFFQGRYCGRVGELILNVWIREQLKVGAISEKDLLVLPYIYIERENWVRKTVKFLRAKYLHQRYE